MRQLVQSEGRTPDVEVRLWLVPHGYQADYVVRGTVICSSCRDYGASVESKDAHVRAVLGEFGRALAMLRQRFAGSPQGDIE